MSYGGMMVLGGAARGLTSGLDDLERQRRQQQEDQRWARRDQREDRRADMEEKRFARDSVTHGQTTRLNEIKIDEAAAAAEHQELKRELDTALGEFIATDGNSIDKLERFYNERWPDGNKVKISRDQASGKFTLDFGDGRVAKDLDVEHVAGMASYMKDPQLYLEEKRKAAEREQTQADELAKEERAFGRELKLKQTPSAAAPQFKVADDGSMAVVDATGARRLPAAEGLTFKGESESGKDTAKLREVDRYLANMPANPGESDGERYVRAWAAVAQKGSDSPEKYRMGLYNKVYEATLKEAEDPVAAATSAESAVTKFDEYFRVNGDAGPPTGVVEKLKEGVNTRFGNGQVWTLEGGRPVRVQ